MSASPLKAFVKTSSYDRAISTFLNQEQTTDASFSLTMPLVAHLRYGENPHQKAALYGDFDRHFEKLHGKDLSFNNILDISAATSLICDFEEATVAILKHTNPCGVGSDSDLRQAWEKAFATDKQAPFGGIIICNREIDESLAKVISEIFSEVIIAPEFSGEARTILQKKKICASFGCWLPVRNYCRKRTCGPFAAVCWCRTRTRVRKTRNVWFQNASRLKANWKRCGSAGGWSNM